MDVNVPKSETEPTTEELNEQIKSKGTEVLELIKKAKSNNLKAAIGVEYLLLELGNEAKELVRMKEEWEEAREDPANAD